MPSGDTRSFCLAPGLAGSCTPRWDPQGKGSLPQTRADKHSHSQGERSAGCTPKDTHCNSSSELVFQVQTTSLAAHSVLLLTAQAHFPSSVLFVLICCPQSDRPGEIIYILHCSHNYSPRVWETHCWTHTHKKSLHEHVIGFSGCGAILKCCCGCHFGIKLM